MTPAALAIGALASSLATLAWVVWSWWHGAGPFHWLLNLQAQALGIYSYKLAGGLCFLLCLWPFALLMAWTGWRKAGLAGRVPTP